MKKVFLIIAVVLFTAGFANKVSAQNPTLLISNAAGGEIMAPLTIAAAANLEFGNMAVQASTGGTVEIKPVASVVAVATGGVSLMSGVTPTAAKYNVGGQAGYMYTITKPNSITITKSAGVEMIISGVNVASTQVASTSGGTLTGGTDVFYLGGILTVPAGQAPGRYTGDFNVSVNYN